MFVKEVLSGCTFLIFFQIFIQHVFGENAGWKSYLKDNPTEFHDLPLIWENIDETGQPKAIPKWLYGTYVRNGPAQIRFESKRRIFASWLEGFAKLHSFKINGENVLYSGKMLESPNYLSR